MKSPALIVVDMQNDSFDVDDFADQKDFLVKNINLLADKFTRMGFPIIWIWQKFNADESNITLSMRKTGKRITMEGTQGCELISDLNVRPEDHQVIKTRYSGFFETGLDSLLKRLEPSELVMCGVNTHACVRMTAIDAFQRDYEVVLVSDASSSYNDEHHRVSMRYMGNAGIALLQTTEEIVSNLN